MTIYETDPETGDITVIFDSRWAHPESLGFKPDEPIYHELQAMYAEFRREQTNDAKPVHP